MRITKHYVALDAADIREEAEFWAAVFGGEILSDEEWDDWITIEVDGDPVVAIQRAHDFVPPKWRSDDPNQQQQQAHLDLYVDPVEVQQSEDEVLELGARLLEGHSDATDPSGFRVYADPAGHPFCICWG